ncbi:MAG: glycosyltransferase family 9 protein [Bryobacteraceae bacterium]
MENALERLASGSRVAVVRLRSLGDCVLTTPALAILKQSRPDLQVAVVVEDRFAPVFDGNPDVQAILPPAVKPLARWRPDLCLNLHGGTRSMLLTAGSAARMRAGFAHFRGAGIYNLRIPRAQEILGVVRKVHTAEHLASAMFYLGAAVQPIPRAKLFAARRNPPAPYAVVHAVASQPDKTWAAEKFLVVGRHLRDQGLEPVFIAGPGEDLSAFGEFQCVVGAPLTETKSLLQSASLFVGNDSGPAHMAAAFGIPVVVLYGSSDPVVWAPWQVECKVLTGAGSIAGIEISEVMAAVDALRVRR